MNAGELVDRSFVAASTAVDREWAWGGSRGAEIRVCVIDSGVTPDHPEIGPLEGSYAVERVGQDAADDGGPSYRIVPDDEGDAAGHGTACAAIIRRIAPDVSLTSVRILGPRLAGDGNALLAALRWAVAERFHVVNLSLSSRKGDFKASLHDIADEAYFNRVAIVASAHNSPVRSYPWIFPSVISVGSHEIADAERIEVSPQPPVEFFAAGVGIEVPWVGGGRSFLSGNSFATPHVTGFVARILGKHPHLPVSEVKHVLASLSDNFTDASDPPRAPTPVTASAVPDPPDEPARSDASDASDVSDVPVSSAPSVLSAPSIPSAEGAGHDESGA
ncbi:S8 family serine peptidase [Streptomyces sp. NBC_01275]|uniref:S8 family serine peptidase n=1 Tax=Streptomyces sp. NBC_01275 TaxID=2903807 RepID=UPI00225C104B|nr:S8 family serine peptidase [Streptomyces sp. NBC_01275]MCX4765859.1 S8 family serine peptidase [Streptomyces sp. NBC_01275]